MDSFAFAFLGGIIFGSPHEVNGFIRLMLICRFLFPR